MVRLRPRKRTADASRAIADAPIAPAIADAPLGADDAVAVVVPPVPLVAGPTDQPVRPARPKNPSSVLYAEIQNLSKSPFLLLGRQSVQFAARIRIIHCRVVLVFR